MAFKIDAIQKELKINTKKPVGDIVLKKLKEIPTIYDVDPTHQLLKDLIETSKLENWKAEITEELGMSWKFKIENPSKTVIINSVLRIYDNNPKVGYFNVVRIDNFTHGIGYSDTESKSLQCKYLIIEYLWDLVLKKNEQDCKETTRSYLESKEAIETELKSLRRNRKLEKLFQN